MRFVVSSGTDIRRYTERYDSATLALEAVTELLARRLPNIRIFNASGEIMSLDDLRALAVEENESNNA
jgi:hypothetical protein